MYISYNTMTWPSVLKYWEMLIKHLLCQNSYSAVKDDIEIQIYCSIARKCQNYQIIRQINFKAHRKFWIYCLNVEAESETCASRQRFSQFWWACRNCSIGFRFLTDNLGTRVVFYCCSLSASRFNMLRDQRCSLAFFGCNKW